MARPFNQLSTEQFRQRMRRHAVKIYEQIWPGCKIEDLREQGVRVHVLDKHFGIDTIATFASGQWITIQEKYRAHDCLVDPRLQVCPPDPDFTQEVYNAYGTENQEQGEWFKLGAQLYFYGWAKADESDFEKWVILDVAAYKTIVEDAGGITKIGKFCRNKKHGKAAFVAITIRRLEKAFMYKYSDLINGSRPIHIGGGLTHA